MATATFSALPAEIHVKIAEYCQNTSLINLCLASKWVNERCLHLLYHHIHLQLDQVHPGSHTDKKTAEALFLRQQQFVHTLLSHPEYSKHVKVLNSRLCIPSLDDCHRLEDMASKEDLWRALQSLRNVRSVHIDLENSFFNQLAGTRERFPSVLFESATSVRLVGVMQYELAKSILDAINPATLKHLCLDMVRHFDPEGLDGTVPGARCEDGRITAHGVSSGLLTALIGRCTALRTLILRRIGKGAKFSRSQDAAADEALYLEWASFIRSVQGTVEKFMFDQIGLWTRARDLSPCQTSLVMHERFRRIVLPAIVSGDWPCLIIIELRGVIEDGQDKETALKVELEASLGKDTKLVVEEFAGDRYRYDFREPFRWD